MLEPLPEVLYHRLCPFLTAIISILPVEFNKLLVQSDNWNVETKVATLSTASWPCCSKNFSIFLSARLQTNWSCKCAFPGSAASPANCMSMQSYKHMQIHLTTVIQLWKSYHSAISNHAGLTSLNSSNNLSKVKPSKAAASSTVSWNFLYTLILQYAVINKLYILVDYWMASIHSIAK